MSDPRPGAAGPPVAPSRAVKANATSCPGNQIDAPRSGAVNEMARIRGVTAETSVTRSDQARGSAKITLVPRRSLYRGRGRRRAIAPAIATAQTGAMVMKNDRMVSLTECDP